MTSGLRRSLGDNRRAGSEGRLAARSGAAGGVAPAALAGFEGAEAGVDVEVGGGRGDAAGGAAGVGAVSVAGWLEEAGAALAGGAGVREGAVVGVGVVAGFLDVGAAAAEAACTLPSAPASPPEPAAFFAGDFALAGADALAEFGSSLVFGGPVFVSVDFPLLAEVGCEWLR